jgi:tripartite-type tricarboxylate transporter receptor subunit TctC
MVRVSYVKSEDIKELDLSQAMKDAMLKSTARPEIQPIHAHQKALGLIAAAFAVTSVIQTTSYAQSYPSRPIRFIVPFAPGGSNDTLARTFGLHINDTLGYQFVVDNRPGANGNIGMALAAKAAADGYTIVLSDVANLAIAPSLYAKLPYDPMKDYAPIIMPATSPNVLVVHPAVPAKTFQELIAYARANPKKVVYASAGVGQIGHLSGAMLNQLAGIELVHIAYKGSSQAVIDVVGGHVPMMFAGFSSTLAHIQGGRLRALAVTGAQRSTAQPNVPTIAESGFPRFEANTWYAVLAPAGAPKTVVDQLNQAITRAVAAAPVKERLTGLGFDLIGNSSPQSLAAYITSEIKKWAPVVKASGAKVD